MTGYGTSETIAREINANYQLNRYNSAAKGHVDNWYKKNLKDYTSYLDSNAVYCNDRVITKFACWSPSCEWDPRNGVGHLTFNKYTSDYGENKNLNCINEADRFAVTNSKAQLTYPVSLITDPEKSLMASYSSGPGYWGITAAYFMTDANVGLGENGSSTVVNSYPNRPVVTLKPKTVLDGGTGTYTDPYIIGPIVDRS